MRRNEKSCVCNVFATPYSKNPVKSSVPSYQNVNFSSARDNKQNIGNPCKHWFAGFSFYPIPSIWCLFGVCSVKICSIIEKDAQYIRIGIQQGILKFGTPMKVGDSREYSYYCPDKKVWEETGYFNKNI